MKSKLLLCAFIWATAYCQAQPDANITQSMSAPMFINPGFTGMQKSFRGALNMRNQWNENISTRWLSGDMELPGNKCALGILLEHSKWNYGPDFFDLMTFYAQDLYSNYQYHIRAGIGLDFNTKAGFGYSPKLNNYIHYTVFDIEPMAGLIVSSNKFYLGFAAYHILGLVGNFHYMRTTLQGGGFIPFGKIMFNPSVLLSEQHNTVYSLPQISATWCNLTIGASVRQQNYEVQEASFLLGYAVGKFKIGYTIGYVLSEPKPAYPYTHEFTIVIQGLNADKVKKNTLAAYLRNAY